MELCQLTAVEDIFPWVLHCEIFSLMLVPGVATYLRNFWAENQELHMILVLFAAHGTALISDILRFILSIKWTLSSEYLILQRQRKNACCNIFLQANEGMLFLKHLMNLAKRPSAAEPDLSNPLSPLIFSSTGCCRSTIIPTLTVPKYWLFIVKFFCSKDYINRK